MNLEKYAFAEEWPAIWTHCGNNAHLGIAKQASGKVLGLSYNDRTLVSMRVLILNQADEFLIQYNPEEF